MVDNIAVLAPKSHRIVSKIIDTSFLKTLFEPLGFDLKRAGIFVTPEEYGSLAILTSTITFFFTSVVGIMVFSLLFAGNLFAGLISGFMVGIILSIIIFISFFVYPKNKIMENEKKISAALPFATYYLITVANSGATIVQLFKILSNMSEYPTIAKEAKRIVFEVENLGHNIADALKSASDRTSSQSFRDLLWGIRNTIIVGGDLTIYLREKANLYLQEYKRFLVKYSQQLSLLVEIYTTLLLVGSIFLMVLTMVIGLLYKSFFIPFIQLVTVFLVLPLVTALFIILFKTLSLEG